MFISDVMRKQVVRSSHWICYQNSFGRWGLLWLLFLGMILGCVHGRLSENESGRVRVAVTIPPQKWLVQKIGGERVICHVLVTAQNDPHTFMGTDSDAAKLAQCQVLFTIGLPIEQSPWCQAILRSRKLAVISFTDEGGTHGGAKEHQTDKQDIVETGIRENHRNGEHHTHDHDRGRHIWLSPRLLIKHAEKVAEALSRIDPANAPEYQQNLSRTRKELSELDRELSEKLGALRGQTFFVFHPAWECFAEDYGLFQQAVETQGKQPSDREMTELQRKARQTLLKVILVQPQFSSRAAKAIADTAGLRVVSVDPLTEDIPTELRRVADSLVSAYRETIGKEKIEMRGDR